MLSNDERDAGFGDVPIRDAACLILADLSKGSARLLMGRRRASQVFLPNKWVFPGGRVDDDDRTLAEALLAASEARDSVSMQAFALAAVRETFEETGFLIDVADRALADPPRGWAAFASKGGAPDVGRLLPVARAITPPGRPRRFDTWFFLADWGKGRAQVSPPDGELADLDWFTLDEARGLDLPVITRRIVEDVALRVAGGGLLRAGPIPFYFQDKDVYRRDLIEV